MRYWTFLSALLATVFSHGGVVAALVDPVNANYSDTWTDIELEVGGRKIQITRTYNSRSNFDGMFGFGWCSDVDKRIRAYRDGSVVLTHCGGEGSQTKFARADVRLETEAMVEEIVSRYRAILTWRDGAFFAKLSATYRSDETLRLRAADRLQLWSTPVEGTTYVSVSGGPERLQFIQRAYVLSDRGAVTQRFSADGTLSGTFVRNGQWMTLGYEGGRLRTISYGGPSYRFTSTPQGKVSSITGSDGSTATYTYDPQGNLLSVTNAWGNSYYYAYDQFKNLVKISYPDKTTKVITYDTERDWVTSFQERDGCVESYIPQVTPDANTYSMRVVRRCGGSEHATVQYRFVHVVEPSGHRRMDRVVIAAARRAYTQLERKILRDGGKPISPFEMSFDAFFDAAGLRKIVHAGKVYEVERDTRGLVTVYRTPTSVTEFTYEGRCLKASEVRGSSHRTFYRYDDQCRIVFIRDDGGTQSEIRYADDNTATAVLRNGEAVPLSFTNGSLTVSNNGNETATASARAVRALLARLAPQSDLNEMIMGYDLFLEAKLCECVFQF